MLLRALEIHTQFLDAQASFSNFAFTPYSSASRGVNTGPATCSQDVRTLLVQLHEASPAYYWYVKASVIIWPSHTNWVLTRRTCRLWTGRTCTCHGSGYLDRSGSHFLRSGLVCPIVGSTSKFSGCLPSGCPFALGILGRLMTSILATSGVVFNIFLLNILCSFPGILSISLCFFMHYVSYQ